MTVIVTTYQTWQHNARLTEMLFYKRMDTLRIEQENGLGS